MQLVYRRVSSAQQVTARQLPDMPYESDANHLVFEDKTTGRNFDRPAYKQMLQCARAGDDLYVHSLDRLGRSLKGILTSIEELTARGVVIHFVKEGLTVGENDNPMSQAMLQIFAVVAELEVNLIKQRQLEGYAAAKEEGRIVTRGKGRHVLEVKDSVRKALLEGKSIRAIAAQFNLSTRTVMKLKKELIGAVV